MRDVNTFSSELKKGMNISIECKGRNNPLLLFDDRENGVKEISKKYNTFTSNYKISHYFKKGKKIKFIRKIICDLEFSKNEVIVNMYNS
jgi:hypothetical protein